MKKVLLGTVILLVAVVAAFSQGKKKKEKEAFQFRTKADSVCYILGADIGKNIRQSKIEYAEEAFRTGLSMGYAETDTLFTREQVEQIMTKFQEEMQARMEAENQQQANEVKLKGEAYAANYRQQPGVLTTEDGLMYRVIKEGTGPKPIETDTVTVYYKGTLIDGTVFDETTEGEPVTFPLGNLIRGWTLGIQMMNTGSKFEFVIPPDLGYGDRGVGPIPGGSTLVFEVELVGIKP